MGLKKIQSTWVLDLCKGDTTPLGVFGIQWGKTESQIAWNYSPIKYYRRCVSTPSIMPSF